MSLQPPIGCSRLPGWNHGDVLHAELCRLVADAAGDVLKRYLAERKIQTVATLALLAKDEQRLVQVLIAPIQAGWPCEDGAALTLTAGEKRRGDLTSLPGLWPRR